MDIYKTLRDLRLHRANLFGISDILETKSSELEKSLQKLEKVKISLNRAAIRARSIATQAELNEALIRDIEENGLPDHLK